MSDVVVIACLILIGISMLLLVARMTIGPTVLDRAVGFDTLVAITLTGLALDAAIRRTTDTVPIMLVLTLLGFMGSVAMARFVNPGPTDDEEDS
ncbi:MAG: cation:proton antiporter [Nocardioidaceae bacterium]|nr:MAG: cation:proton antiporter [Nocardioidaceae bacterium]